MRRLIAIALVSGVLFGAISSASAAPKPLTVFEDAAGDAGNADSGVPGFDYAGFDIASGSIAQNGKNLEFTVTHHQMLPTGTVPEAFRFIWNIFVNKEPYRFTVKRVDIGKPDAAQGQTTERVGRVDVNGHFRLEGECVTDSSLPIGFVNCPPVAYLDGRWEADKKSFTIILPLKLIKAKAGTVISMGSADNICGICWITHYAERSLNSTMIDSAAMSKSFKVK